eukprot:5643070-Pleurochrysis_carterae.AAC.7
MFANKIVRSPSVVHSRLLDTTHTPPRPRDAVNKAFQTTSPTRAAGALCVLRAVPTRGGASALRRAASHAIGPPAQSGRGHRRVQ